MRTEGGKRPAPGRQVRERRWGIEPAALRGEWWRFGNAPPPISREI